MLARCQMKVLPLHEMVGNYALQPFWNDGHHTGLYTWEYLKRLCVPETAKHDG